MRTFVAFLIGVATGWMLATWWNQQQEQRLEEIRAETIRARGHARAPQPSPTPSARPTVETPDDLTRIHGIGPVFQKRLHEAGMRTFGQLAAANPQQVRDVVGAADWQRIEPERWIDEAAALANG